MKIEILGAESLGVWGLSCFVETENYKILIDPGIALGYILGITCNVEHCIIS